MWFDCDSTILPAWSIPRKLLASSVVVRHRYGVACRTWRCACKLDEFSTAMNVCQAIKAIKASPNLPQKEFHFVCGFGSAED